MGVRVGRCGSDGGADVTPYDGSVHARQEHARLLAGLEGGAAPTLGPRPTKAQLEKHAARFGPDQVAETAAELGVDVEVTRAKKARAKGPTLKQRVAAHVAAGHSVDVIAEMEDLSPARARRLVEEVG